MWLQFTDAGVEGDLLLLLEEEGDLLLLKEGGEKDLLLLEGGEGDLLLLLEEGGEGRLLLPEGGEVLKGSRLHDYSAEDDVGIALCDPG